MKRRRLGVLVGLVLIGGLIAALRAFLPAEYDTLVSETERLLQGVPDPILLGIVLIFVVAIWIAAMILFARFAYWFWQQINDRIYWFWDLILPESPVVRFAAGVMVMIFIFAIGPLIVIQALDLGSDDADPINESDNESDPANETTNETADNETNSTTESSERADRMEADSLADAHSASPPGPPREHSVV
jgi:hypothetical protein